MVNANGVIFNDDGHASNDFRVASDTKDGAILLDAGTEQIGILTKGQNAAGAYGINKAIPTDTGVFISGSIRGIGKTSGDASKGTTVVGGDTFVSGTLVVSGCNPLGGGTISGSIHLTDTGISYIAAGANITVVSASNGQITVTAAGGGEWTDGGSFLRPSDSSGAEHIVIGGNSIASADTLLSADGAALFNQQGNDVNFRVESDNKTHAIFLDGGTQQIKLLSGTGVTGGDGAEISLFISGSVTTPGSERTTQAGTSVFGGDLVVSGGIYLGGRLFNEGDHNTYIRPRNDEWQIYAGGKNLLQLNENESTISFNQDSNAINTIIFTDTKMALAAGTPLGAGQDQILIFSGGAGSSYNEAAAGDVLFYISGSRTKIGTAAANSTGRNSKQRTNTIFGGDVIFSGSIYGGGDIATGTPAIHLNSSILQLDARTQIALCDNAGRAPGFGASQSSDTFFSVSGTMGNKGSTTHKGTAVFGGDVLVSGSLYARQSSFTTHKLTPGNSTACFVRFDSNGSDGSAGVNNKMVTPYPGTLVKVVLRSTNVAGSTVVGLHTHTNGNANLNGTATENKTVDMSSANTAYTFFFTPAANWGPGDIVGIKINPTNDPGTTVATAVWELETYAAIP